MALDPLASESDLATLGVDISDASLAALALDMASAAVREAAGSPISALVSTVDVEGGAGRWLSLPFTPVREVTEVAIDGDPVSDWRLISGSLFRRDGWASCLPTVVTVTAAHGYNEVPADIVLLVCELAGAGISAAIEGVEVKTRVQSEGIDDYTVSYVTGAAAMTSVMELTERTRLRLAQRFGGGSHVVGARS